MIGISGFVVHLFVLFLLGLGLLSFIRPITAQHFFDLFAASKQAHLTEQAIRLVVGFSLVHYAVMMNYTCLFRVFGWLIVITSLLLIVLPWQWHQQFAQYVIPYVKSHLKLYAVMSLFLAVLLLYAIWAPEDWI